MAGLRLTIHGNGIYRFEEAVQTLGEKKARNAYRRAVNEAGRDTKAPTTRALAKQTGLKISVTRRALRETKASAETLTFKLTGTGGDVSLKYFGARETRKGVSAAPFGVREIFERRFMKGGRFPKRKTLKLGGHVYEPAYGTKKWGRSFSKERSGVIIPNEMVKGITAEAFNRIGHQKLGEKVARHIRLSTKGVLT